MKRYLVFFLIAVFALAAFAQTPNPRIARTTWNKELAYIQGGTMTFTYKTMTSPTLAGTIPVTGATNYTQVNAAGGSANPWDYTGTLGAMNGSDDFTLFDINMTNANHTGSNTIQVFDVAGITGDAEATEIAFKVATGWDYALYTVSPVYIGSSLEVNQANPAGGSANPVDFTTTLGVMDNSDDFTLIDVNLTNVDHTGTGNVVKVLDIANITGDAQATETAISIGTGWDIGIATSSALVVGAAGDAVTLIDTLSSPSGVAKWARFTVGGVSFVAVNVADTARIVD